MTESILTFAVAPLHNLPDDLAGLEAESMEHGFSMVHRLRHEWEQGLNRFNRDGEILLGAFAGARLIGVGGISIDPFLEDSEIGRLRHIYVLSMHRRSAVGSTLVRHLLSHARTHFRVVRLWTGRASEFYDALGFEKVAEPKATHRISLG